MIEPLNLCLYGGPGIGKTPICATLCQDLAGALDGVHLDLQRGCLTYRCRSIDILGEAEERGIEPWEMLEEAARVTRAAKPKFIIVDTIGELADWADAKALARFKDSPMGKSWDKGEGFQYPSILDLPGERGSSGWGKMWDAFQGLLLAVMGSYHRTIFIGHPRDKIAFAVGKDPNVKQDVIATSDDLDLAGKMRRIFSAKMAAIGFMYRDWEGKRVNVNFSSRDAFAKTRCPHLDGRTLWFSNPCTLAEWARIYPQTLSEHLLPQDREALAPLLAQYGGVTTPAATTQEKTP